MRGFDLTSVDDGGRYEDAGLLGSHEPRTAARPHGCQHLI